MSKSLANETLQLRAALRALTELCEHVPVFQLDNGKSSVKAVRLAGKFVVAVRNAKELLDKVN